jgi:hypothetical protein
MLMLMMMMMMVLVMSSSCYWCMLMSMFVVLNLLLDWRDLLLFSSLVLEHLSLDIVV